MGGGLNERRNLNLRRSALLFATKSADIFPGMQPKSPNDLTMKPYLESHYKQAEDDHGIHIMERK